ncbi:MAG: hypothetical protein A3H96_21385 [Acidobacteria bacterium RIFCSPLOWO2_02_FULL_67_36]|nr:MAG: hypothetical protein A3H96_21385 [Acidobacteria bacterium RIFCSPLOWO2_02_FULL_67_36]
MLWELEAIWRRKRQKLMDRIRDETTQVGIEATIRGTETDHVDHYHQAVTDLFERFRLSKLPLTSRPLGELVIASARHELPFAASDSGFRDALVLLSIVDACLKAPQNELSVKADGEVWYLTTDNRQKNGLVSRFAAEGDYPIFVYEIETAQQELTAQADAKTKEFLEFKTASARGVLQWPGQRQALASFMKKRLEVPFPAPELMGYVIEWADVIVESISSIAIGGDRADGQVNYRRVSFVAVATVGALVKRLRTPGHLLIGEPTNYVPTIPSDAVEQVTGSPEYIALTLEAEVDGEADSVAGEYNEFDFISLRVKRIEPR